jgi:tRNA pseudouridine55 synthase
VGEALGCGGLVEVLVRTRIGPFALDGAVDLEELSAGSLPERLRPAVEAVAGWPRLVLDPGQVAAIAAGRRLAVGPKTFPRISAGPIALVDPDGRLVALAEADAIEGRIQPRKVFTS